MTDEVAGQEPTQEPPQEAVAAHAPQGRRFKPHELGLADGGRLVLHADGSIDHVDPLGSVTRSWVPDDPEWPHHAIRFGVHPQAATVAPSGRRVQDTRPPRI
jgi:hypothetical protein